MPEVFTNCVNGGVDGGIKGVNACTGSFGNLSSASLIFILLRTASGRGTLRNVDCIFLSDSTDSRKRPQRSIGILRIPYFESHSTPSSSKLRSTMAPPIASTRSEYRPAAFNSSQNHPVAFLPISFVIHFPTARLNARSLRISVYALPLRLFKRRF